MQFQQTGAVPNWVKFKPHLIQIGSKRPKLDVEFQTGAFANRCDFRIGIPMTWFCVDDFPKFTVEVLIEELVFSIFDERERE